MLQASKIFILTLLLAGCSQQAPVDEIDNLRREIEAKDQIIDQQQQIIENLEKEFKGISQRVDAIVIQKEKLDRPYKICPSPATANDFPCVVAGPESIPVVRGYRAD